jgi:hypothetical protein
MANTAKFNNFQQQLAQLKEKKPELYNDANYAYAMWKGGVQDYIDGKSNGIGNLSYTNYTDYNKEVSDTLIEFEKMNDDEVVQIQDPNNPGALIEITKKGLSPEQIKQIAQNSISASGRGQMQIDAWANSNKFQDMDDNEIWKSILDLINRIIYDYEREMLEVGIPEIVIQKMKVKNNDTVTLTIDLIEGICNSNFYKSDKNLLKVYSILNILLSVLQSTIFSSESTCNSINGALQGLTFNDKTEPYHD